MPIHVCDGCGVASHQEPVLEHEDWYFCLRCSTKLMRRLMLAVGRDAVADMVRRLSKKTVLE